MNDSKILLNYLWRTQPNDVILDLGTNDIGRSSITCVAHNLIDMCEYWLQEMPGIHSLTWCHMTPRCSKNRRDRGTLRFNRQARWLNRRMAEAAQHNSRLHHWRHRGLSNATIIDMPDGIHPSSMNAKWAYQKSISRICKWAKKN